MISQRKLDRLDNQVLVITHTRGVMEIALSVLYLAGFRRVGNRKWKTLEESAAILGVSVDTVRRRCRAGRIEHRRDGKGGRGNWGKILIHLDDLKKHLDSQRVPTVEIKTAPKIFPSIRPRRRPQLKHLGMIE